MQKVYLLLRENHQSGPHSIEELAHLELQSTDLIWIEGASSGWYYPHEVAALAPLLKKWDTKQDIPANPIQERYTKAPSPLPASKKVFVSMPAGAKPKVQPPAPKKTTTEFFDQRAEQLRKKVQEFPVVTPEPIAPTQADPSTLQEIPKPVIPVKEEPAPIVNEKIITPVIHEPIQPKKEHLPQIQSKEIAIPKVEKKQPENFSIKKSPLGAEEEPASWSSKKDVKKGVRKGESYQAQVLVFILIVAALGAGWWVIQSFSNQQTEAESTPQIAKSIQTQNVTPASNTETEIVPAEIAMENNFNEVISETPLPETKKTDNAIVTKKPVTKKTPQEVLDTPVQQEEVKDEPVVKQETIIPEQKTQEPVVVEEAKKPGIIQKIGGLFKKKPKEENPPATNESNKQSAGKESSGLNITDQLDVKMNTTDNKWMLGVQGLKLTILNRSNVTLKKAAIDVIYYNDQNGVIEKKTIYFSNVPPKKTQSVAAPDHQYADHAGYKIISAVGD